MINRMVLNNLCHRPLRTALSVIAVAVEVLLILSVIGLVTGLLDENARRQKGLGADIIVQPSGGSQMMGLGGAPMPVKIAERLREIAGVVAVTPVLMQSFGGLTLCYGIESTSFNAVTGGFQVLEGRPIQGGYEVMVDDIFARINKVRVGDKYQMFNHDFAVVGIVQHGKGARLFAPLGTVQELVGSQGKTSVFYVKLGGAEHVEPVLAAFKGLLPGYAIRSMEEFTSLMNAGAYPGLQPFQRIMVGIAVVIGFLVIFLAMYTTVLERTREIGILKSLGASKLYIVNILLRETALVALLGIIMGIGASLLLRHIVITAFPQLSILITGAWVARASFIAVAGAMFGAAYPAVRAARQDPIAALAYE